MPAKKTAAFPDEVIAAYDKLIATIDGVERKGAAMPYTSVNGHMFSFIAKDGTLALRLPADSIQTFLAKHKTTLCEAHGTVLKEYVSVPDILFHNAAKMTPYFKESYAYVASLKPKPTTKPATKKK